MIAEVPGPETQSLCALGFIVLPPSFCQLLALHQINVDAEHADKIMLAK
jgi:hypothetical protein